MAGSTALVIEYEQLKDRLDKIEATKNEAQKRRNARRRFIQHGGVLSISSARHMTQEKEKDDEEKARRKVERANQKRELQQKKDQIKELEEAIRNLSE